MPKRTTGGEYNKKKRGLFPNAIVVSLNYMSILYESKKNYVFLGGFMGNFN
jgi:hypothetical protein